MERKPLFKKNHSGYKRENIITSIKAPYEWPTRNGDFGFFKTLKRSFAMGSIYAGIILLFTIFYGLNPQTVILFSLFGVLFGFITVFATECWNMGFMIERLGSILLAVILLFFSTWLANKLGADINIWSK